MLTLQHLLVSLDHVIWWLDPYAQFTNIFVVVWFKLLTITELGVGENWTLRSYFVFHVYEKIDVSYVMLYITVQRWPTTYRVYIIIRILYFHLWRYLHQRLHYEFLILRIYGKLNKIGYFLESNFLDFLMLKALKYHLF